MNHQEVMRMLKQFHVQPRKIDNIVDGVYKITDASGKTYVLKRMTSSTAQLRWIDNTLQSIRKHGFTQIAWRQPFVKNQKKLFVWSSHRRPYILHRWIKGRWASPDRPEEMIASGRLLAQFQLAAQKAHVTSYKPLQQLGSWPRRLEELRKRLSKSIELASKGKLYKRVNRFLQAHGDELLAYAKEAQNILASSSYVAAWRKAAKGPPPICHGDGGPSNIIIQRNNYYLIDFETLCIDLPAYDLYRIIYNSCQFRWDIETARAILTGYNSVLPLTRQDIQLAKAWLRFPRTTNLLLSRYHRSRSAKEKLNIAKQLPEALNKERKVTKMLQQLDQMMHQLP